jgi:hypothetical protein
MGKSTINGPFSIAMLVYQRVYSKYLYFLEIELGLGNDNTLFKKR